MAEPVDYFMQGVGLGQRSRSIRNQEDQFRTNLAERARQANQMFDLRQKETESQISRNNLYVKKLDYDMSQQKKKNDEETVQLDSLKQYKDSLSETANDQSFPSLPLPPSDLLVRLQARLCKPTTPISLLEKRTSSISIERS